MNVSRRKKILKSIKAIEDVCSELESVLSDEDEARDNIPENLQDTNQYVESQDASEALDTAIDLLNEAVSSLEEVV